MTSPPDFSIRPAAPADQAAWKNLYVGYRNFYGLAPDTHVVDTAWNWAISNQYGVHTFVAETAAGELVGLANVRVFPRPSRGRLGLYLDDLFTDPLHRGRGIAAALLATVAAYAESENADVVRWITAADNSAARSVYDALALQTSWVTYDMPPAASN